MDFDVIVSGAGLTGTSTALALSNQGFQVALIEASDPPKLQGRLGFDLRTLALSPANSEWLESLGFDDFPQGYPIERMQVWERCGSGCVTFDAQSVGIPSLAAIFEHSSLISTCRSKCQREVEMLESTHIVAIENGKRLLKLSNEQEMSCNLLCIAEGPNSNTRKIAGGTITTQNLGQSALVTLAKTSEGHRNTAWQKFDDGILAFLPYANDLVSVIWSLENSRCEHLMSLDESDFARILTQVSERVCGEIVEVDERKSFPLSQSLANTFNPQPWIAVIGDSAHTLHPLSGQGVNLGLEDARAFVQTLLHEKTKHFSTTSLTKFAQHRRLKARMMIHVMSFFLRTWSLQRPSARWIRNVGIRTFDKLEFIKHQVVREAIGFGPLGRFD